MKILLLEGSPKGEVSVTMQVRLAGFASDKEEDVDGGLTALADSLHFLAETGYAAPDQFPTVSSRKVFRYEIFGGLCRVFPADHRYYKSTAGTTSPSGGGTDKDGRGVGEASRSLG